MSKKWILHHKNVFLLLFSIFSICEAFFVERCTIIFVIYGVKMTKKRKIRQKQGLKDYP